MKGDNVTLIQLFGHRVRQLRQRASLSQEALAELANLHRTYIGSIERGERNVSLENVGRIAAALKVGPSLLLTEEQENE